MSPASPTRVAPAPATLTRYRSLPEDTCLAPPARPCPTRVGNRSQHPDTIEVLAAQMHDLEVALSRIPDAEQRSERSRMLRAALYDLTRAAKAERLLAARIAHHAGQQAVNNMPGALRETGGGGTLGVGVGLPGAIDVGVRAGLARAVSTATFDDLAVARFDTVTLSMDASAEAGLPEEVGAHATLGGRISWGQGRIADKMPDHVLELARASVARRLGGSWPLRTLKRVFNADRDRYAERVSRAQAWQPRLPMLLGQRDGEAAPAFHPAPPAAIEATMKSVNLHLGGGVRCGPGGVNASGSREKIDVHIDLPVRLTERGADATRALPHIRRALDARLAPMLERRALRSPTLQRVDALWRTPANLHCLADRRVAVAHLAAEFNQLEGLARLQLDAPRLAELPLASLARDWCTGPATVEQVMIRMLDTLGWLQATPRPPSNRLAGMPLQTPSHLDTWTTLQTEVDVLATRIHDSRFPHNRRTVHQGTHAFAEMRQHIRTRRGTLEGTAQWTGLGAGARASVARQQRADSDPLRDGDYVDVTFATDLTPGLGALLVQAQRVLGEAGGELPMAEVEQVLTTLAPSFPSTAHAQCVLRFFRPRFQDDPRFPARARGTHLQAVRLAVGSTMRANLAVPVPLLPGTTAKLGLQAHHTEMVPQHEYFCNGTLTGTLLRYNSLRTRDTDAGTTWTEMEALHGPDLDRLAAALARPDSVPADEARFWLQRHPDAASPSRTSGPLKRLTALSLRPGDAQYRRKALHALFVTLGEATSSAKRASPLIDLPVLPTTPQGPNAARAAGTQG